MKSSNFLAPQQESILKDSMEKLKKIIPHFVCQHLKNYIVEIRKKLSH